MKPISDNTIETLEETALAGAEAVKAYLAYKGENPDYARRAKVGVGAITGYARIRQSESGRMAVELAAGKVLEAEPRRLKSA